MPRLSDSMTEGTIVRWIKAEGDAVQRGEEIVEVETDKATVGYEAEVEGTLSIREPEGAVVAVGAVIAEIAEIAEIGTEAPVAVSAPAAARVKASPLARRLAQELGVDLAALDGSGPHGRVIKSDVMAAAGNGGEGAPGSRTTMPAPGERTAAPWPTTSTAGSSARNSRADWTSLSLSHVAIAASGKRQ